MLCDRHILRVCRGQHVPETIEYGITSLVFRAERPFHPRRLHDLLESSPLLDDVVRSKGVCWLATKAGYGYSILWGHAGAVFQFTFGSFWWATGTSVTRTVVSPPWRPHPLEGSVVPFRGCRPPTRCRASVLPANEAPTPGCRRAWSAVMRCACVRVPRCAVFHQLTVRSGHPPSGRF